MKIQKDMMDWKGRLKPVLKFQTAFFHMDLFRRSQDACLVQQEQNGKAGQINQTDNGEEVHAHGQFVAFVAFNEAVVQPSEHWGGNEGGNHGEFEQLGHCAVEPENYGQA